MLGVVERGGIEKQIERSSVDAGPTWLLNWIPPVARRTDLPADASEGDACYVEREYSSFVHVNDVGWLQLTRPSGVFP